MSGVEDVVTEARGPLGWTAGELKDRDRKLALEWLETDGLGGFACGTVGGARTRRYHGWFVPAIPPPRRRWLLVATCEEFVTAGRVRTGISTQEYRDAMFPEGDQLLVDFALKPFPIWRYKTEQFEIERSLCLVRDRSVTIVRYVNRGTREIGLEVRPLVAFRGSHDFAHEGADFETATEIRGEVSWVRPAAYLPRLYLRGAGAATERASAWYRYFQYRREAERGEEVSEDLWSPLAWTWTLPPGGEAYALFSVHEIAADPKQLLEAESLRRNSFEHTGDSLFDVLASRAETFVVEGDRSDGAVLAGYPWLADRARDATIAAAGLALATGRFGSLARVLNTFAAQRREGLLPACFPGDQDEPDFGSIDAPLWFILAVEWFGRARRDSGRPAPLLASVRAILSSYHRGTRFGIKVAPDGLLTGGVPGRALTWMDSLVDGKPAVPRIGKAVEVNALWHAALKVAARLERLADEHARARSLEAEAWHVARRFQSVFWSPEKEHLHDVVNDNGPDPSVRPNQIFAVSLSEDLLPPHHARAVYWTVRRRLLTPFGLRTLDPRDARYRGKGGPTDRENALAAHQGGAWPWLLGAFADAHFRILGNTEETRRAMRMWLIPLRAHLKEAGLGSISEWFDAEPPHLPRGAPASAMAAAEVLRILYTHLQVRS
jgi:predicted glycogen debranching enzyme